MIRQRLFFAALLATVTAVVAVSGDADARNCRCGGRGGRQGGYSYSGRSWGRSNGYAYAGQSNYAPANSQPMLTTPPANSNQPTPVDQSNAPTPPAEQTPATSTTSPQPGT